MLPFEACLLQISKNSALFIISLIIFRPTNIPYSCTATPWSYSRCHRSLPFRLQITFSSVPISQLNDSSKYLSRGRFKGASPESLNVMRLSSASLPKIRSASLRLAATACWMRAWGQEELGAHTCAKQEVMNCAQLSLLNSNGFCSSVRPAHRIRLQIITSCSTTSFIFTYSTISGKISSSFTSPSSSFSEVQSEMPWAAELCSDLSTATMAAMCSLRMTKSRLCLRLRLRRTMKRKKWSRSAWACRNSLKSFISQLQVLKQLRVQKKQRTKLSSVAQLRCLPNSRPSFTSRYSCSRHRFDLFFTARHPPSSKNRSKSSSTSSITCWINSISIFSAFSTPTKQSSWQTCQNLRTKLISPMGREVQQDCCLQGLYFSFSGGKTLSAGHSGSQQKAKNSRSKCASSVDMYLLVIINYKLINNLQRELITYINPNSSQSACVQFFQGIYCNLRSRLCEQRVTGGEESLACREGGGMACLEDAVLSGINGFRLFLCRLAPEQEHHVIALFVDDRNDMVCELLPAAFGVRVWLAVLDSERSVEQEDSLLRPSGQIAVRRRLKGDFFVGVEVFVDVFQRGRGRDGFEHAEAKSMGLVWLMVGILPHYDHLDVVDWGHLERVEDVFLLGVDLHKGVITFLPDSYCSFTNLQMSWKVLESTNLESGFSQLCSSCLNQSQVRNRLLSIRYYISYGVIGRDVVIQYQSTMEVGELARLHAKKQELKGKRQSLIQEEIKKKRREKVNLDQSSIKKGFIEKQKIIAKKKFETLVEKARKIPIELQENVNVNTFITSSGNFDKILARTKERVQLNRELMQQGITAINSYAVANKEFVINFTLEFEKEIVCEARPFLISVPEPQPCKQVIIVLPQVKEKDECYQFQKIKALNLSVMSHSQFVHKFKNDKIFTKKLFQQSVKCFVKWQQYKNNKFYVRLLNNGVPVFPIDAKKVPFALQETIKQYPDYIEFMSNHYLCVTKTGKQQIFRLKAGSVASLLANTETIIHSLVGKLIERSKVKQNKLLKISLKTASSINFEIYNA